MNSEVYNGCHDISMMGYELKDIVILNVKFVDYWCIILDICGSDAFNMLSNYKLDVNSSL